MGIVSFLVRVQCFFRKAALRILLSGWNYLYMEKSLTGIYYVYKMSWILCISRRIHYLFSFCRRNLLNPRVLRQKQQQQRQQQTLHSWRGAKDLAEFSATQTQSHLSGSDRSLRHRPLHGVPQRTGRHCTRALHLIIHSYGRVIVFQLASAMSPT